MPKWIYYLDSSAYIFSFDYYSIILRIIFALFLGIVWERFERLLIIVLRKTIIKHYHLRSTGLLKKLIIPLFNLVDFFIIGVALLVSIEFHILGYVVVATVMFSILFFCQDISDIFHELRSSWFSRILWIDTIKDPLNDIFFQFLNA